MEVYISKPISVGIKLQNSKFEACAISDSKRILFNKTFISSIEGYESFFKKCQIISNIYNASFSIAIETSNHINNSTDFKKLINYDGFYSIAINTLSYKKNNSKNNALKIAEILLEEKLTSK